MIDFACLLLEAYRLIQEKVKKNSSKRRTGFKPATSCLADTRSIQLSYRRGPIKANHFFIVNQKMVSILIINVVYHPQKSGRELFSCQTNNHWLLLRYHNDIDVSGGVEMAYRVNPKTGMIECDEASEAIQLASMITGNAKQQDVPMMRRTRFPEGKQGDMKAFFKKLKSNARKLLDYLLQMDGTTPVSLDMLKTLLETTSGKTVGGTITSITRRAGTSRIAHPVEKDPNDGTYHVSRDFIDAYERAGRPKIL